MHLTPQTVCNGPNAEACTALRPARYWIYCSRLAVTGHLRLKSPPLGRKSRSHGGATRPKSATIGGHVCGPTPLPSGPVLIESTLTVKE